MIQIILSEIIGSYQVAVQPSSGLERVFYVHLFTWVNSWYFLLILKIFSCMILKLVMIMFQWIFWVGPFIGAAIAAFYHQYILRAAAVKAFGSFKSTAYN